MKYFDAHIHLERYEDHEIKDFMAHLDLAGVIAVSMDLPSSIRTLKLKQTYPEKIFAACGFHPEQAAQEITPLISFIKKHLDQIDAIGEIGWPYYVQKNSPDVDEMILRNMLEVAAEGKKPVILHAVRQDVQRVIDLLKKYHITHAHFHWIKADFATLEQMADLGYYVSFTPDILYNDETARIAANYPLSYIMVETDGPWRFEGPFSNQPTTPHLVQEVIQKLSKLRQLPVKKLSHQLIENTRRFLRLPTL